MSILHTSCILWKAAVSCPSKHTLQLWCLSAPLHHLCPLNFVPWVCIDPFKSLTFTAYSAGLYQYHTLEAYLGCHSQLSVDCTPPSLVSLRSSPSPLSAKLCSMSVLRSVEEFDFCGILRRLIPIAYTRSIFGRAVVSCPSNVLPQLWYLSAPLHHLCLKLCSMCVHRSVQ